MNRQLCTAVYCSTQKKTETVLNCLLTVDEKEMLMGGGCGSEKKCFTVQFKLLAHLEFQGFL